MMNACVLNIKSLESLTYYLSVQLKVIPKIKINWWRTRIKTKQVKSKRVYKQSIMIKIIIKEFRVWELRLHMTTKLALCPHLIVFTNIYFFFKYLFAHFWKIIIIIFIFNFIFIYRRGVCLCMQSSVSIKSTEKKIDIF